MEKKPRFAAEGSLLPLFLGDSPITGSRGRREGQTLLERDLQKT